MNVLIYDIEIKRAILGKNEEPIDGIDYCAGWQDHANMGISCIGAYDYAADRYRVFMDDNYAEFTNLVAGRDVIVSFNGLAFDNRVCAAHGIAVPDDKSYDILVNCGALPASARSSRIPRTWASAWTPPARRTSACARPATVRVPPCSTSAASTARSSTTASTTWRSPSGCSTRPSATAASCAIRATARTR